MERRVFGPVPSRRLGRSLGVNNIPYKVCTYSCIYCQVGKAIKMQINRQEFYKPDDLVDEVKELLNKTSSIKNLLDMLLQQNLVEKVQFGGHSYYLRKFTR
jgi:wyosine [tRNA(Phe)-imidazoG37] synthetase (radical SAM superfamily)